MNNEASANQKVVNGRFEIEVEPNAISAIKIDGVNPLVVFQHRMYHHDDASAMDLLLLKEVNGKAMVLDFGEGLRTFYLYLHDDDQKVRQVELRYKLGKKKYAVTDKDYPFEFTVDLPETSPEGFAIRVTDRSGKVISENIGLRAE